MMNNTFRSACFATMLLVLTACGGGGGGGSDAPITPAPSGTGGSAPVTTPSTPPSTAGRSVTGAVTKGPVSGAILEVFNLDQFGQLISPPVAVGTTNADGSFNITVPANSGILIVVARGGSFLDESDQAQQRRIQLDDDQSFLSFLEADQTAVAVTPLTTAVVTRGRVLGGPDGTFLDKFNAAKSAMNTQAGFDVFATVPANPVAPEANASTQQKQYALILGGLANLINNVSIQAGLPAPNYETVVAVTFDLVDGQLDGKYFGLDDIPNNTQTPQTLPSNTSLADEITRFRNNNFENFGDVTVLPNIEIASFANTFPTSNAGTDITVLNGQQGQLDGSLSSDAESGLFFSWAQTAGTTVALSSATVSNPTFTAPARLIGNETLTFELTVIDPIGFTSTDTVNVQVLGSLPTAFYIVDQNDQGDGIGENIDGGALLTLDVDASGNLLPAMTGRLLDEEGTFPFTASINGNVLTTTFATPFLVDDFDQFFDLDGDGNFTDEFLVEEQVDFFDFTLVTDNPNGDELTLREPGTRVFTPINGTTGSIPSEPYEFVDPVSAFDPGQATPFVIAPGDQRMLLANTASTITTLFDDDSLHPDIFTFVTATTGTTENGVTFTYSVNADGTLQVDFDGSTDSAKYTNIVTIPTGDIVGAEFTLQTPLHPDDENFIGYISLSFPKNNAPAGGIPTNRAQAAGVYSGLVFDDQIDVSNVALRLNPDGTGSLNFDSAASNFFLFDFDDVIVFRSNFGVCWDVDANNRLVVNRAFSLNEFPNTFSSETTTSFCTNLLPDQVDFQFVLTQFDNDGTTVKHFDKRSENRCFQDSSGSCTNPGLEVRDFNVRISTKVPLNATPPVAALDDAQTDDTTPITINLVSNDVMRDLPIDPNSVVIETAPVFGSITVPDVTGSVVYTPPTTAYEIDVFQYSVADSGGNRSQIQTVQIINNPCESINGTQGFYDRVSGDCDYAGLTGSANVINQNVLFGALPNGGVHRFDDSIIIGDDFNNDAALLAAGISQGGTGFTMDVGPGAVLAFSNSSAIISISRGSQIFVGGTPTEPAVFTSTVDVDSKRDVLNGGLGFQEFDATQQWGGLVIQGFGRTNGCTYAGAVGALTLSGECHLPSPTGVGHYGGNNNTDSSGALNYLQIRYAGGFVNQGEAAGLSLQAVGAATVISEVQVYSTEGDGMQLLGGAVNVNNFIGQYARDSAIGFDEGYSGLISNALMIQEKKSGAACISGSGILDFGIRSPGDISLIISQELNSRPTLSNLTCIVSGLDIFGEEGAGFEIDRAAFPVIADALVILPGQDNINGINFCIAFGDESLQGLQDLNSTVTSSIFACPDKTDGGSLPNFTPVESFLIGSGNQFATLATGSSNPAPVASAASGNVLLEGSPLIYSLDAIAMQVDSSPSLVTPTNGFVGAVQLNSDWTQNWTFGLHPGLRIVPLWYEAPIIAVPNFVRGSKGQSVFLDASQTISNTPNVSFQWTQIGGPDVGVAPGTTTPSISFTGPGVGTNLTQEGGIVDFELVATDDNGLMAKELVNVRIDAQIPQEFFTFAESLVPFSLGTTIIPGQLYSLDLGTGSGFYTGVDGTIPINFTDDATTFTVDFSPVGGLSIGPITSFDSMSMTELQTTNVIDSYTFTLISDNGPRKFFDITTSGKITTFDVTNSTQLPDVPFTNLDSNNSTESVTSTTDGLFLPLFNGSPTTISLVTDIAPNNPTLRVQDRLQLDTLLFNGDGTGFANIKNESFQYSPIDGTNISVAFAGGDFAEYTFIANLDSGDANGVFYTRADSSVVGDVSSGLIDAGDDWMAGLTQGIYTTTNSTLLDDGTEVPSVQSFRLHPDGSGQVETEIIDTATGMVDFISVEQEGICWQIDIGGDLTITRTTIASPQLPKNSVPDASHCSQLNVTPPAVPDPTLIDFTTQNQLFEIDGSGRYKTIAKRFESQCFDDPLMTCDPNIIEFKEVFQRNFDARFPFVGNPPLAGSSFESASAGIQGTFDPLTNIIIGDVMVDPTTVTIIVPPKEGVAVVDPMTGFIDYTPNAVHSGFDFLQFQVLDTNGNKSTIGEIAFTVSGGGGGV